MSVNGQLELVVGEEKTCGFLSFKISESQDDGNFVLTARLKNDKDKKKYKKWECDAVIGRGCGYGEPGCQRRISKSLIQAVVSNGSPSSAFFSEKFGCPCDWFNADNPSAGFILSVFLRNEEVPKHDDTTSRFTDELEAKKLNANLKIRFEDSEEPVFANRELLAVYSNVFRVMFEGDFKEKNADEIKLEVKRQDFLSFADCLYFPSAPVATKNFKAVSVMADYYDCPQLLEKCKEFAEKEAQTATTPQECKDFIEMADRFGWNHVLEKTTFDSLMINSRNSLMEFLDYEWMMALKENARRVIFDQLIWVLPSAALGRLVFRDDGSVPFKRPRFTKKTEAKEELNADCKFRFKDTNAPLFVNRHFLSVYSKVFREMFEEDFKDDEEIKLEVDREDFLSFLACLYYPPTPVTMYNFKAVTLMADRYDCPELLKNCKKFAEMTAKAVSTVEDCEDLVEVSERLHWNKVLKSVIKEMKKKGAGIFIKLLDSEEREENTQQALFKGLKEVIAGHVN